MNVTDRLKQVPMPKLDVEERIHNFKEVALGYTEEQAIAEASRCLQCKVPKCVEGCPVGIDIPAFIKFIREGKFNEAIKKIKEMGGIPVLAHPSDTPEEDVHALIDCGLMGLEVYSSYHDQELTDKFLALARKRGLLVTAGSDFHGLGVKPNVALAGIPGNDDRLFIELKQAACR